MSRRDTGPGLENWLKLNAEYADVWPNIAVKRAAPPDADAFNGTPDKFETYFSPNPGLGDGAEEPQPSPPAAPEPR
jgi:ferredoxin